MPDHSDLGDRMKKYEAAWDANLMPFVPAIARLDGKAFHTFTRGLERPYDQRLSTLMVETTRFLVGDLGACIGYTQSDEISLVWFVEKIGTELPFDGRTLKLASILAAKASVYFNKRLPDLLPEKIGQSPVFDCRVFSVPTQTEAANCILWRELDATRNSISMAAQACFSHNQLMGKNCDEMQEMLFQEKGINWNDYPSFFKRGTYIQKRVVERPFTSDEIDKLPPKHAARTNPDLKIWRTDYRVLDLPPIPKITNREAVIFAGAEPVVAGEQK